MLRALRDSRPLSGIELLLGAGIVIGHNVWRVLPNEVPILFALGLVSLWLRNGGWTGGWRAIGVRRPDSWMIVIVIALTAAALRLVLGEYVIEPLTGRYWPEPVAPAGIESVAGDLQTALTWLLLVWTFAAIGEEVSYRGYLLRRAAELFGNSTAAHWLAVIVTSALFGIGHFYKGPSGMIDSGVAGLILGAAYMLSGRILWTAMLAHGLIDTFGIVLLYFGWDS